MSHQRCLRIILDFAGHNTYTQHEPLLLWPTGADATAGEALGMGCEIEIAV